MSFKLGEYLDKCGQIWVIDCYRKGADYPVIGYAKNNPKEQREWTSNGSYYSDGDISIYSLIVPKKEQIKVSLTPDDIEQGAAMRHRDWPEGTWEIVSAVSLLYVRLDSYNVFFADVENEEWEIRNPGGEWQPFYKLVEK